MGIAVCDPGERVASPVCVLPAREVTDNAKPFKRVLEDWEPELLLCGLPKTLAGEEGPQAKRIRKVADAIAETTGATVETFYSCQTVSQADWAAGEGYVSLMRRNVAALREGIC